MSIKIYHPILLVLFSSILTYPTKFSVVFSTKSTVWPWKNLGRTLPDLNSIRKNGQFENIIEEHDNIIFSHFIYSVIVRILQPGARFSKLPVITGPVKLFCFPFQMGVSKGVKVVQ